MNQLDAATRQALCRGDQPPPGVEDRILAAILPPIVPPGGPPGGSPGLESATAGGSAAAGGVGVAAQGGLTLAYAVKVVAATLGLAAGGLGLLAVTAQGVRALADSDPKPREQDRVAVVAAPPSSPSRSPTLTNPPESPFANAEPEARSPELDSGLAGARPSAPTPAPASAPKSSASAAASAPGVEAELALIQRARTTRDPEATLALLTEHAERFPDGVFAAEREVLRVEQLCALGRTGEAEAIAASFLARRPQHPLRSRIQPACPKQP